MDTLIAFAIAAVVGVFFLRGYLKSLKKLEEQARDLRRQRSIVFRRAEIPASSYRHRRVHWLRRMHDRVS